MEKFIKQKKAAVKKALLEINFQNKRISELYKLGVDLIHLDFQQGRVVDLCCILINPNPKNYLLIKSDIDWWLYENDDKKIYDGTTIDVTEANDFVKYLFNIYGKQ